MAVTANSISIIMIQVSNQHPRTARKNLLRTGGGILHGKKIAINLGVFVIIVFVFE